MDIATEMEISSEGKIKRNKCIKTRQQMLYKKKTRSYMQHIEMKLLKALKHYQKKVSKFVTLIQYNSQLAMQKL